MKTTLGGISRLFFFFFNLWGLKEKLLAPGPQNKRCLKAPSTGSTTAGRAWAVTGAQACQTSQLQSSFCISRPVPGSAQDIPMSVSSVVCCSLYLECPFHLSTDVLIILITQGSFSPFPSTQLEVYLWDKPDWFYLLFFFLLFKAAPEAYGSSWTRGQIGAAASGLCHSSWQCWILNQLSRARDWTWILMNTSQVCYRWATKGTPDFIFIFFFSIFCRFRATPMAYRHFQAKGQVRAAAAGLS